MPCPESASPQNSILYSVLDFFLAEKQSCMHDPDLSLNSSIPILELLGLVCKHKIK